MNAKVKGYILAVIAAATYGMNPLFALPLYQAGMNPDSVLFFRVVLIILAVTFVVAASHLDTYIVRLRKLFPRLPLKKS